MPLFRIINGNEEKINIVTNRTCFNSDKNNAVVLKSVGPSKLTFYGELISYSLKKK